jgi:hypothetical protein
VVAVSRLGFERSIGGSICFAELDFTCDLLGK